MDGQRFDDLTQRFASLLGRRRFAQALAAIGAGAALGLAPKAKAKKKKKKRKPKKSPCQRPATLCSGECVDTETDERFCGSCTNACATGQTCVAGACADVCTPACPSDRPCYRGKCTCTGNGQCQRDRDPDGDLCVVNPPDRPELGWCGCIPNFEVCALGEACSFCCTGDVCPDEAGVVCALPPAGSYRSRGCCVDLGFPCDSNDDCCSRRCNLTTRQCECAPKDAPCSYGRGCCSTVCSIPPNASGTCA